LLIVVSELRPLVTAGSPDEHGVSLSTAFVFAVLLRWGLPLALLLQTVGTVASDVIRRRPPWRTGFNLAQCAAAWSVAAGLLAGFGHGAGMGHPSDITGGSLPAVLAGGLGYFVVNDLLVAEAMARHEGVGLLAAVRQDIGYRAITEGALLALAPIVVVVAAHGAALIPLLVLPIAAVYATASVSLQKEHQAHHDALTGLPNRKLLLRRAAEAIESAQRTGVPVALFLLDLDRFKEVNDTLGHATGDALLELVARRLHGALRPGDTVARLGGDEFAVLLPAVRDVGAAEEVASRVHRALAGPFRHQGVSFDVEGSLGIALYPDHASDVAELMQRADVAMYLAKEAGTGIEVYCAQRDRHSPSRLGLFGDVRRAISGAELELYYQPKAAMASGEIAGLEALLRWRHPRRGVLGPEEFLPVAESSGLIRQVTQFVIESALDQIVAWRQLGLAVPVAINVSARDLSDGRFADYLATQLEQRAVPVGDVQLEITESALVADPARAGETLQDVASLGVSIALDDFGTGYSSLMHLRSLPVSEIKIDRSFVQRMDVQHGDAAIVRSIVDLGAALGLHVVAEGVETSTAWRQLTEFGCPTAQGWYYARAMPAEETTARLRERSRVLTPS
jgi:diguanylate cyclase (GGDEF)-like protein